MNFGFVRVGCASPLVSLADCAQNAGEIIEEVLYAEKAGVRILALPELAVTGYTCGDLFLQDTLLRGAEEALAAIARKTAGTRVLFAVGIPVAHGNALYNCAAFVFKGKVLGLVPKTSIPNYSEFYEARHFTSARELEPTHGLPSAPGNVPLTVRLPALGYGVPLTSRLLIQDKSDPALTVAAEICEDAWVPEPPSTQHALAGATVILNLSASNEIIGKAKWRETLVSALSGRLACAYLYATAGNGESTSDMVFAANHLIAENGTLLARAKKFHNELIYADIDVERLTHERRRMNTFAPHSTGTGPYTTVSIDLLSAESTLSASSALASRASASRAMACKSSGTLCRPLSKTPFVPENATEQKERCEDIITMQAMGLAMRLAHTRAKTAVVGLSGGLDSTLALLVTLDAFTECGIETKDLIAVTMPGFGTTDRTYTNACTLARETGCTLREISIAKAVTQHFEDIGHRMDAHDVTYENSQARERTQILMDIANQTGGLVIGTGDLSELALGWATYNGDHMSMYGVNASIPKTLVRYLVSYCASRYEVEGGDSGKRISGVLKDILDTPVSPELLPPVDGKIAQKTEELVGPYELHDFFLYYVMRWGFAPRKIHYLAKTAFSGVFEDEVILKWLKTFYRRFFSQQFKRNCLPDGAKVGTVSLSPRGDWRMPSDASAALWLTELENL